MPIMLWEGKILIRDSKVAIHEDCCCGETQECDNCDPDTVGSTLTVTFQAGTNNRGNEALCTGDCDDWAASWVLHQATAAEVAALTGTDCEPTQPVGCVYILDEGLPCGADCIVAEVYDGGSSVGTAHVVVSMCGSGWQFSLSVTIGDGSFTDDNCLANIDSITHGVSNIGYTATGNDPCDFLNVLFDFSLIDVVMNP